MYKYQNDYGTEVKGIGVKMYTQGYEDVLSEIWSRLEWMEANAHRHPKGWMRAVNSLRKFIDAYFESQGFDRPVGRAKVYGRRMKMLDITIDNMIASATKAGYLVPEMRVVS